MKWVSENKVMLKQREMQKAHPRAKRNHEQNELRNRAPLLGQRSARQNAAPPPSTTVKRKNTQ